MPTITIRNLEEQVKQRLRVLAAEHGRSMEAEARDISSLGKPSSRINHAMAIVPLIALGKLELVRQYGARGKGASARMKS